MNETIPDKATILDWLEEVKDPEVPVLSIIDLGIVRDIRLQDTDLEIVIPPIYLGSTKQCDDCFGRRKFVLPAFRVVVVI